MGNSVNKTLFGNLLRTYQKRAGVRQNALAGALGVSPSAMSQMMAGRLVPSSEQLEKLGAMLALERGELDELREQLSRIRGGGADTSLSINDLLRAARLGSGYSLEKISEATGIPVADLIRFETQDSARPSPTEAVRLGAVLGIELSELYRMTPQYAMPTHTTHEPQRRPMELLRERTVEYRPFSTVSRAPLVRGSVLKTYEPGSDFPMDYCWRHMDMMVESAVPGVAVVRVSGGEIGLMPNLFLELEVVPGGACGSRMLVLGMDDRQLVLGEMTESGEVRALSGETLECRFAWPIRQFRGESMPQAALEQMQNWNPGGER